MAATAPFSPERVVAYWSLKLPGCIQSSVIRGNLVNLMFKDPATDRGASELVPWSVKLPGVESTRRGQSEAVYSSQSRVCNAPGMAGISD